MGSVHSMSNGSSVPNISEQTEDNDLIYSTLPGTFEDLHKKAKDTLPSPTEGLKFSMNRSLSGNFQVSHSINLSGVTPCSYIFGSTYIGSNQLSKHESYPILMAEIDNSTNLNAQIIHHLTKAIRTRFIVQTKKSVWSMIQADATYFRDNSTTTLTSVNSDPLTGDGIYLLHHLHRLTPSIDLGVEYMLQNMAGQSMSQIQLAARLIGGLAVNKNLRTYGYFLKEPTGLPIIPGWIATISAGLTGLHASYYRHVAEGLQVAVDGEFNFLSGEGHVGLGYTAELPKAGTLFKGSVNSDWTVIGSLEKRLLTLPLAITFSGILDHLHSRYSMGLSIQMG